MGRGNVCVTGQYEGLYYIDYDHLNIWYKDTGADEYEERTQSELSYEENASGEWHFDHDRSEDEYQEALWNFIWKFLIKYPSFRACEKWITNSRKAVLENKLFYIAVEDNEWSVAIMLIQKDTYLGNVHAMQKRHYQGYLNSIRDILFEQFETLGTYGGAWTSGKINRSDFQKGGEQSA